MTNHQTTTERPDVIAFGNYYRTVGYWFATGWHYSRPDSLDYSSRFGDYCSTHAIEYRAERVSFLPSVPDMWRNFTTENGIES